MFYVSNNMGYRGFYKDTYPGNGPDSPPQHDRWILDEGWQIFPYRNPRFYMGPRHLDDLYNNNVAMKIDALSFKVDHFHTLTEQTTSTGGVTTLKNVYEQKPYAMFLTDKDNVLEGMLCPPGKFNLDAPAQGFSFVEETQPPNNALKLNIPKSQDMGMLPRCIVDLGQLDTMEDENGTDWLDESPVTLWEGFDIEDVPAGGTFQHNWKNPDERWYPLRREYHNQRMLNRGEEGWRPNGYREYRPPNIFDLDPDMKIGSWDDNIMTDLPCKLKSIPPEVLVKLNYAHGPQGALDITGYFTVQTEMVVTIMKRSDNIRGLMRQAEPPQANSWVDLKPRTVFDWSTYFGLRTTNSTYINSNPAGMIEQGEDGRIKAVSRKGKPSKSIGGAGSKALRKWDCHGRDPERVTRAHPYKKKVQVSAAGSGSA